MIANTALLAALVLFLLAAWLAGELTFLAPYKRDLFSQHGLLIVGGALVVFFNLHAAFYVIARWLFLRDTGHKLTHLDGQLITPDALDHDLRGEHLTEDRSRHV
jgi:hypothetical protein